MDIFVQDLRYSARMLRRTPGTSAIAALALALGIGLTTLMFSIVYAALYRGLPFDQANELVMVTRTNVSRGIQRMPVSIHDFEEWQARQRSFDHLGAYYRATFNVSGSGASPERYSGAYMTPATFASLGMAPVLGRWLEPADDRPGATPAMVIGWRVWQDQFAADPGVLGRTVRVNGRETSIVGVMPRGFGFPNSHDVWLPLGVRANEHARGAGPNLTAIGRLRDGVSIDQAGADLAAIARTLEQAYPETNEGVGIAIADFARAGLGDEARPVLFTMFGAVLFVLLIACANVANVLMGRAIVRGREVAVRTALGASRLRVARQFLIESFLIAVIGALAGSLIGAFGIRLFNAAIVDTQPPFWLIIRMDVPALLCAFAATLLATLAAGTLPALQASRSNTSDALKDESRGSSSLRLGRVSRALVAFEMALSVGLLLGAGLMIKSVVQLYSLDFGVDTERLFVARAVPVAETYDEAGLRRFADALHERLRALPGVDAAAIATEAPGLQAPGARFAIEGETDLEAQDWPLATVVSVSNGYFETVQAPVLRGRDFTPSDRDGSLRVAIVNRAFEQRFMNGDALGRRIRTGREDTTWTTIVGVVPDLYASGVTDDTPEAVYRPLDQVPARSMVMIARTAALPTTLAGPIREAVASIDPDLPLFNAGVLETVIYEQNWQYGVFGSLFISFGVAALFLAAVGLYGVMAFSVSQRTREMGVRMAVGARPADVIALVLRQGLRQAAIGLSLGVLFAIGVSRLLATMLFQVSARDPFVLAAILATLLASALLACYVPARRATRVDPLDALRTQ